MRRLASGWLLPLLALAGTAQAAAPRPASAAEKIAVLVTATADKDAELADNLTEVIIAHVARQGGFEIAGKEEFRARLGVESDRRTQACLDDIACLGRAAVSLGVRRIVAGTVGTRGKQFLFNLNLDNVQEGRVESRVFRLVEGDVEALIRAVQEAASELFRPRVEPGKIQIATDPEARACPSTTRTSASPPSLADLARRQAQRPGRGGWPLPLDFEGGGAARPRAPDSPVPRKPSPQRRRWPTYAAYGSATLAGLSFAAGGFLGVLSQLQPSGDSRQAAMADLDQKKHLALGANVAFGAGAVFSVLPLLLPTLRR